MSKKKNKVYFGLERVHIAFVDDVGSGRPVYGEPIPIPGAVSFSPAPNTDESIFYADNSAYYATNFTSGYAGDLEAAKFPEEVLAEMFGWPIDSNGALIETNETQPKQFALMAAVKGDQRGRRIIYYCCTGSVPSQEYSTTTNSVDVKTEKMAITVTPINLGEPFGDDGDTTAIRAVLEYPDVPTVIWQNFFKKVYLPGCDPAGYEAAAVAGSGIVDDDKAGGA